ncbi:hypothetical protein CJ010_15065 [Azoarcus sp. DD4]|uniref:hypothetical protein n=1 Tax=Azoarcus sp. DD4 TaxID=2027405 RepID=UPI00112BFB9C|nr:hypothetical protein [Azoarcus sp. DD4]QDF97756.1 hypothetical protein CJ010_15065 [Azoarcus sp. DD4]
MIKRPLPSAHAHPAAAAPAGGQASGAVCTDTRVRATATGQTGAWRSRIATVLALAVVACSPAADHETTLDKAELRAVIAELDSMARHPDRAADRLVARNATPERIDKLFRMPELTAQRFEVRRQALALAGRGSTLGFDRPSEVLGKLAGWFPERFGTPQARKGRLGSAANRLYGPYPDWNAEATAFMMLWECMPQIAWEEPEANPFLQRRNDNSFAPLAATNASQREIRNCVFELSGEPDHLDIRQSRQAANARAAAIGARAAPVLAQKFDAYLHASGCSGKGPDDCVLLMWMWAGLAPDDARLAETLRWLEPAVRPTGEPPPLSKPAEEYGPAPQENNEPRFDEAIRKAAFLRAKLDAVLLGPANWPADARTESFLQLAQLQAWFDANVDQRWHPLYAIEHQHDALNPWKALGQGTIDVPVLLDELDALPADTDCATREVWFRHGGPAVKAGHVLRQLRRNATLVCGGPDWAWLAKGETPAAATLRGQFLENLGDLRAGFAFEGIVDGLLAGCMPDRGTVWADPACAANVSQPMTVSADRRHDLLHTAVARDWPALSLSPPPRHGEASAAAFAEQTAWLQQLALTHGPEAATRAARLAAALELRGSLIHDAAAWLSPSGIQSVIELQLSPHFAGLAVDGVGLQSSRVLVLLDADSLRTVSVPARFSYPQDDGGLAAVTDIDGDGWPEVWLAPSHACADPTRPSGQDCTTAPLRMGEVRDEVLSYYKDHRPAQTPPHAAGPH